MILFRPFKFWCQNVLVTNGQSSRWDFCLCLYVSKRDTQSQTDSKSQKEQNPSISQAHLKFPLKTHLSQISFSSPQEPDWLLGPWHYSFLTRSQMKAWRMSQSMRQPDSAIASCWQTVFRPHLSNTSIKPSGSHRCLFLFDTRLSAVPDAVW